MRDPRDLYSFASDRSPQRHDGRALVMIHAFPGLVDAGSSCRLAAEHLLGSLEGELLVRFDADELLDYRGSRPIARFDGMRYTEVELPDISLHLLHDEHGVPFLLLEGPEPDLQWRRLAEAVVDLVEFYGVDRVVGISAFPTAVPHTRPISLIAHATEEGLVESSFSDDFSGIEIPASFASHLEHTLGRAGHRALGYAAQIPHYLTRSDFPQGALALLRRVSEAADLSFPLVGLGDVSDLAAQALARTLEGNEEVANIVQALERQYDSGKEEDPETFANTVDIPTAEEIGDRFQRFLADQDNSADPSGESTADPFPWEMGTRADHEAPRVDGEESRDHPGQPGSDQGPASNADPEEGPGDGDPPQP